MGRRGRLLVKAAAVLAAVLVALAGAALAFLYSPLFRYPTDGEYPEPHIRELVWPTIGFPALATPGGVLEVEVDLREGEEPPEEEVSGWKASLLPARKELAGLEYELEFAGAAPGPSGRWPGRDAEAGDAAVWLASFRVPGDAVPELYDLRVEVEAGGERVSDSQPHAVAVMEDDDGDFTFVTLSDIHVHERGNSAPFSRQTDKGVSESGDPLFFREAVRQVNLIRPDFVLMLGDYVRGQRRPGELAAEYERFYQVLLELEVPAFLVPGNHDGYVNGIDGKRWYEENIGPLYYSFDMGGCHFTCLDTYQWPRDDRVVMNKLFYMEPRRWQGQVLEAADGEDPSTYGGQLAWAEEDLAAHEGAPLLVVALHHDPYSVGGEGRSYWNLSFFLGLYRVGGGGKGAEALRLLASRHRVHAVFGGHLHLDAVGSLPWEGGGGETVYSCQTCVYFDAGGRSDHYPGYRLVEVEDGEIASLAYLDGESSYPFYEGSVLGGTTDLDRLERPALDARVEVREGSGGPRVAVEAENLLGRPMTLYVEVAAPAPPGGGYPVEGGEVYRSVPMPGRPGWVLLYLRTTRPGIEA